MKNLTVESTFLIDGNKCNLHSEIKGKMKCYVSEDGVFAYITDDKNEVMYEIQADCAQNFGFLKVN